VPAAVPPSTDQELQRLRRGHVSTILQMPNGNLYAPPGGGIATSGLSVEVVHDCDWYGRLMQSLEKHVSDNIERIVEAAADDGVTISSPCRFRLHVHEGRFVAVEQSSNWGCAIYTPT